MRLANPLSEQEPLLRTTLLPGLLKVLALNVGRGFGDAALFEIGVVFRPRPDAPERAPRLAVDRGPTAEEIASWRRRCPTSRTGSRSCCPATGSRPAGGVRDVRRCGRTRSRPPAWWPMRSALS